MITILSGTNRSSANSFVLAKYYQEKLEAQGEQTQILDLDTLPADFIVSALYENQGKNEVFNGFVETIKASEKIIMVVAEYNGSFPGVLKAFIDGMPYPEGFQRKKFALVGLSAGTQGAALALSHLTDILNYLGGFVYPLKVRLPIFSAESLKKGAYDKLIEEQLTGLTEF
ncbi:MAG: NAD(P)H-dependent oxidoreductase [Bacteroidota bacterium]